VEFELPFHDLATRHPGLTKAIGDSFTEAARVCLDRHHASPIRISIEAASAKHEAIAKWNPAGERERGAWANEIDTTMTGAYGIALAVVEVAEGMFAIRRAENGTGADYYVAPANTRTEDLEAWFRLEISGVDRGDRLILQQRLNQKVRQALDGQSNLPALAAVVGFRARCVAVARAESP
jgi:hypothetical protein